VEHRATLIVLHVVEERTEDGAEIKQIAEKVE
jgi:hypothetical protein